MHKRLFKTLFIVCINVQSLFINAELSASDNSSPKVKVNKCCEDYEVYYGNSCNSTSGKVEPWVPAFMSTENQNKVDVKNYRTINGKPDCGSTQQWPIFHYKNSTDRLKLLPNGVLRHYYDHPQTPEEELDSESINNILYHDYEPGRYCMDKKVDGSTELEFAWVCPPEHKTDWTETDYIMKNVVNPITHGINIICLLTIAIIYFIMPTLRDLVGNIVTTICMCLIVSQTGDIVRLLTVLKNHISLIITDTICYISLLGAFFWLNSLGYYVWKTFKSRNVYLRITDKKKYCYYSAYAWTCTIILGVLAVFAHYTMDYPEFIESAPKSMPEEREEIGSLGMIIFFVPVAFTIICDIFFFATTLKSINRLNTYGRIHHKLRHCFRMFLLMLFTMTVAWLFFLTSFSKYDGLINTYIIVNAFQGPLLLYICLVNQRHVAYLVKKTCCYKNCICSCCRPEPEIEWGDEMTAMSTNIY